MRNIAHTKNVIMIDFNTVINKYTRITIRPDASVTLCDFKGGSAGQKNKRAPANRVQDGYIFGADAKRRLKNYVISASINGYLDGKNAMFATFTFTESLDIQVYEAKEHDEKLSKTFQTYINNLKINHGLKEFIYVAERHTGKRIKNEKGAKSKVGWLHYHTILIFDTFFPVQKLNYLWLKTINKHLNCKFTSHDNQKNYIASLKNTQHNNTPNNLNNTVNSSDKYIVDECNNWLFAISNNSLRDLSPLAFETVCEKEIKRIHKYLYSPVDIEFLSDKKTGILKVIHYITKYITKSEIETEQIEVDGIKLTKQKPIYSRIWSASRLFTSQIIERKLMQYELNQIALSGVKDVKQNEFEIIDKETGEISKISVYTIILDNQVYKNKQFLNLFKQCEHETTDSDEPEHPYQYSNNELFWDFIAPSRKHETVCPF